MEIAGSLRSSSGSRVAWFPARARGGEGREDELEDSRLMGVAHCICGGGTYKERAAWQQSRKSDVWTQWRRTSVLRNGGCGDKEKEPQGPIRSPSLHWYQPVVSTRQSARLRRRDPPLGPAGRQWRWRRAASARTASSCPPTTSASTSPSSSTSSSSTSRKHNPPAVCR